jgi:hypothetical protein
MLIFLLMQVGIFTNIKTSIRIGIEAITRFVIKKVALNTSFSFL